MHALVDSTRIAYAEGHRDARHAAAELALKADALADAVQDVLVWRESAPLTGYLRDNDASREALARLAKVFAEFAT